MKTLKLTCFILLLSFVGYTQIRRVPVADETFLKHYKNYVELETSNEVIFKLLVSEFKADGLKYTAEVFKSSRGYETKYTVKFKKSQREHLTRFLNSLEE